MIRWLPLVVLALAGCVRAPLMTGNSANSSAQSGNASGQSGQSSAQSGQSSGQSGQLSGASGASSQSSAQSSAGSNASSQGSANVSGASNASSQASAQSSSTPSSQASSDSSVASSRSTQSSGANVSSSQLVLASSLLASVAGGIVLSVYASRRPSPPPQPAVPQLQEQSHQPVQPLPGPPPQLPMEPPPEGMEPAPYPQPPPPPMEPAPYPLRTGEFVEPPLDSMVLARAWLKANTLQLKQDLALGAGPALEDLAGLAGIAPERRAHFYRLLQRHRRQLLPPPEYTPREAALLLSRVGALVLADPLLRQDGDAVLTRANP